jgi:hypothetical protein
MHLVLKRNLDAISLLKKGRIKCYIYCNVSLPHSSILTTYDNAGRIKENVWSEKKLCCTVLSEWTYQKYMM